MFNIFKLTNVIDVFKIEKKKRITGGMSENCPLCSSGNSSNEQNRSLVDTVGQ